MRWDLQEPVSEKYKRLFFITFSSNIDLHLFLRLNQLAQVLLVELLKSNQYLQHMIAYAIPSVSVIELLHFVWYTTCN